MIIYIILTIFTCTIALFVRSEKAENEHVAMTLSAQNLSMQRARNIIIMSMIFIALLAVSALRKAIGHDYWEYTGIFSLIAQDRHVSTEFGFNTLVRLFQAVFGVENYFWIFAFFAAVTVFFFLRGMFEQAKDFGMTFFLFMVFGYYLTTFSAVRYYFVLAIAFFATSFLLKKEFWKFAICIVLASFFHKAVLLVLLAYPLALIKWNKITVPLVALFTGSLLLFPNFYRSLIFHFYPFYENSVYDTGETSVANILRCVAVLVFALIFYKRALKGNRVNMFYFNLNLEALIVYACCSFIPVVSRIGFFFNIFQIFLIPAVISSMEKKWQRTLFTILTVTAGIVYYALFLHSCKDDGTRIVPYLNWILN
ncbi:MAG: EpsG family protein [Lachnospiraceae bacterium]|nr:EpsG family protein [Lachnospiraceae bacterium]